MKRRQVAAAVLVPALAVLALLACGFTREPRYIESPMLGRPAPAFSLALFDGRTVRLEDFQGKVVGITYPNGRDADGRIAIDYGVWGLPEAFVIDRRGRITYKHIGTLGPELLANKIAEAHRGVVSGGQGRGEYQSTR